MQSMRWRWIIRQCSRQFTNRAPVLQPHPLLYANHMKPMLAWQITKFITN